MAKLPAAATSNEGRGPVPGNESPQWATPGAARSPAGSVGDQPAAAPASDASESPAESPQTHTPNRRLLARRLAWVTGLRLVVLVLLLGLLSAIHFKRDLEPRTLRTGLLLLVAGFALTAGYAGALRWGQGLRQLALLQLLLDPLIWTGVVYLSGGPLSAATSLYGLSCVIGALLMGFRGATLALALSATSFLALLLGAGLGWWPPAVGQSALPRAGAGDLVYSGFLNLLAMLVVAALAGSLAERLRVTGGELAEARERMRQAERLAALGRVAAGLAHEIRNPLGAISSSIGLLADNPQLSPQDTRLCAIVQRETQRLGDLVSDMVNLSKPRPPEKRAVDLAAIAGEVVTLAQGWGRAAGDVEVVRRGCPSAPVWGDPAQLRQLTWNLVRNAVQASASHGQVRVLVEAQSGGTRLEVQDDGPGLDAEAKARVFDVFYSTRSGGTGLGLALVKRIADDHGFTLRVESETGRGARFVLELPATGPPAASPAVAREGA